MCLCSLSWQMYCMFLHLCFSQALYATSLICLHLSVPLSFFLLTSRHTEFHLLACTTSPAKSGYYLSLSWTQCTARLTGNTTRRERRQAITGEVVVELVLVGFRLCLVSYVAEWWWIRFGDSDLQAALSAGGKLWKLFSKRATLNLWNQMNSR